MSLPAAMLLKLLPYLAMSAAGWLGWWAGRHVGIMTAYLLCVISAALGLYYGRRLVKQILGE